MNKFIINTKLPSLNEVINQNRTNRYLAAKFKSEIEELIGWAIRNAQASGNLHPIKEPCYIDIEWHEATKRRDVDNIQSSQKFILDALVKNRILINDNRRYVKQIHHIIIDDDFDFIVVRLIEQNTQK